MWPAGTTPPPPHEAIPEVWLDTIDEAIKHRGPDGQGRFRDRVMRADGSVVDVALVHRRLAIIDPACGQQPMVSERGRSEPEALVAVVFNGCIYNHRELRRELASKGHLFSSDHSDTEVLLHAWREWGFELLPRLHGMYTFALWDRAQGRLVLGRDPFGEKPGYVTTLDRGFHGFASTVPALHSLKKLARTPLAVSPLAISRWIRFGFDEVSPTGESELKRGMWTVLDAIVDLRLARDPWDLPEDENGECCRRALQAAEVDAAIHDAVGAQLETDVPLGCYLSGGIDSSLIAHSAMKHLGRLQTFAVRMPALAYDESPIAQQVASILGTTHTTLDVGANPAAELPALIRELGLPFGDSSLLPSTWLNQAARRHVKVSLGGEGGDELFLGYERHTIARRFAQLAPMLSRLPAGLLATRNPKSKLTKLARLADAARSNDLLDLVAIFPTSLRAQLYSPPEQQEPRATSLDELAGFDCTSYLCLDLMRKADTASMHSAMELRSPLLHPRVVSLALQATHESLMPRGERKGLLRQVARKYLPTEIVDRPKQGFAIPIGEWFRSDYGQMKQLLLDHMNAAEPWPNIGIELNRQFVAQMLHEHMGRKRDHSQRLYMLLVLSIWAKSLK